MNNRLRSSAFALIFTLSLAFAQVPPAFGQPAANPFDSLKKGQVFHGFRTEGIYLDDSDKAIGAHFVHAKTGFTLDLIQIQSVPQAYFYANTYTVSDMGEPHTQEHLLITKGNKGRNISVRESMSMTQSNASTFQTFTDYPFSTAGGPEAFYSMFAEYVDVLLHPDYTEEDVRREVRNWGVSENPDKSLKLEEKGSVYNEMTSSMNNPDSRIYDIGGRLVYGDAHPQSFNAGGSPEGIRRMTVDDIKRYHAANYHLANMGAIVSLPRDMTPDAALTRMDSALSGAGDAAGTKMRFMSPERLPAKKPAPAGTIRLVDFPTENAQQPASMLFAYPAERKLDLNEKVLLDVFLNVFAGSPTTNLYKKFIDSKTREIDTGAQGLYSYIDDAPGFPLFIGMSEVPAANLTSEKAALYRQKISEEFARVAAFKDGSPELKEFNERVANALTDYRRNLSKFVNTPPGFGFRNGGNGYGWMMQTRYLSAEPDFRKSVTFRPQIDNAQKLIGTGKNVWRDLIPKWGLAGTEPYVIVAKANPKLIEQDQAEKKARADAKVAELKAKYKVTDDQEAIRRYRTEYDATTAELEKLEKGVDTKFIENPPLSLDPQLDYKESMIGPVKMGVSTFDNMTGATTGVALRLDQVNENELVYLSLMPALVRNVGVIRDGKAMSFEEMSEILRKEILNLNVDFAGFYPTGRREMVVRGSGNDPAESERAVRWMKLILENPNWSKENLPRIRDVVNQELSGFRRRMQGSEESWVGDPAEAYRNQSDPVYLSAFSFLTQAHNAHRLSWMLKDAGDAANRSAIGTYLEELSKARGTREDLNAMLTAIANGGQSAAVPAGVRSYVEAAAKLPPVASQLAKDAAKDLQQTLNDIPDASLASDWSYLCDQMRADLAQTPEKTLAELQTLRQKLLNTNGTRSFYIGAEATRQKLEPAVKELFSGFSGTPVTKTVFSTGSIIDKRLAERGGSKETPVYVGLMAPNMTGGVIQNSAFLSRFQDTDRERILDHLASRLYSGGGSHSVFSKTIGAGLAYSNGVGSNLSTGNLSYYAERTPEMPVTMKFAIGEIKRPMDTPLVDYVIAQVFSSRASSPYEVRGEAMAANITDGMTPEVIANFRRAILEAKKIPDLSAELYRRKDRIYERVFPGYGIKGKDVPNHNYFVIGPEKQMAAYEAYLRSVEGPATQLYRLYPRDFWLVRK